MPWMTRTVHSSAPRLLKAHHRTFPDPWLKVVSRFTKAKLSCLMAAINFSRIWRTMKMVSVIPLQSQTAYHRCSPWCGWRSLAPVPVASWLDLWDWNHDSWYGPGLHHCSYRGSRWSSPPSLLVLNCWELINLDNEQPRVVLNPCLHLAFVSKRKLTSIIAYSVLTNDVLVCAAHSFGNMENAIAILRYCGEFIKVITNHNKTAYISFWVYCMPCTFNNLTLSTRETSPGLNAAHSHKSTWPSGFSISVWRGMKCA